MLTVHYGVNPRFSSANDNGSNLHSFLLNSNSKAAVQPNDEHKQKKTHVQCITISKPYQPTR